MKFHPYLLVVVATALVLPLADAMSPKPARVDAPVRHTEPLDADWRFVKGDASGAEQIAFDDGAWRTVSVPHDWSIEGPFDEKAPTRGSGAFLPSGVAWYRKHLK